MATRSSITVKRKDGKFVSVYCHWDGYLSHNGAILQEHYATYEKALALVSLGNISSLAASIECPEGHSFETPVKGYTNYYTRDRGENSPALVVSDMIFVRHENWQEYNYLYENGQWHLHCKDGSNVALKETA